MKKIAIFISGAGSNAERMILRFSKMEELEVSCLISSKKNKRIESLCKQHDVSYKESPFRTENHQEIMSYLLKKDVGWLVLAGFLKKIPEEIIKAFPNKIINLHPSLLPKYGGKGMYGMHVHNAVIDAREKISGITIHYVNEEYDKGKIIKQFNTSIEDSDDSNSLFEKIRELETLYFPQVVENEILNTP
ncbi:MAG: formyltransferase family protein [Crocinitomicaceae bacterium]|jgi:phosphoribosylglycinamide formyltransferase 1|nr:formyltransferase family protein [Crocinitomicaceae bacterium]